MPCHINVQINYELADQHSVFQIHLNLPTLSVLRAGHKLRDLGKGCRNSDLMYDFN